MPALWLVRHVPAAGNIGGVFMGQLDGEPAADGLAEAATRAGTIPADLVLASPLARAARTAQALFPDHEIRHDPRLMERHFGVWQGRVKAEVQVERPDAFTEAGTLDLRVTPPAGESLEALQDRVGAVLAEIAALPDDRSVAMVAHNGVLRTVRVLLGLLDLDTASRTPEPFAQPDRVAVTPGRLGPSASAP